MLCKIDAYVLDVIPTTNACLMCMCLIPTTMQFYEYTSALNPCGIVFLLCRFNEGRSNKGPAFNKSNQIGKHKSTGPPPASPWEGRPLRVSPCTVMDARYHFNRNQVSTSANIFPRLGPTRLVRLRAHHESRVPAVCRAQLPVLVQVGQHRRRRAHNTSRLYNSPRLAVIPSQAAHYRSNRGPEEQKPKYRMALPAAGAHVLEKQVYLV